MTENKRLLTPEEMTKALEKYAETNSVAFLHVERSYGEEMGEVLCPLQDAKTRSGTLKEVYEATKFTIHTSGHAVIIDADDWSNFLKFLRSEMPEDVSHEH